MTARYPYLYRFIQGFASLLVLLCLLLPQWVVQAQLAVAVLLILLIGIPHGATDYLIFKQLSRPLWGTKKLSRFYLNYVLLMLGYGAVWYFLPTVALAIFLVLSIYHFGQSNWNYLSFDQRWKGGALYLLWGSFVVLVPILWHYEEAAVIIASIVDQAVPIWPSAYLQALCLGLFLMNVGSVAVLTGQGKINWRQCADELINLLVLGLLFIFTPLLLGFAIYFVCWHSLSSVMDQVRFFKRSIASYSWRNYLINAIPLTLVAIAGLGLLVWVQHTMDVPIGIGALFVFISVVTLPHMILIEQLYEEMS